MKKLFTIACALVITFSLAACGCQAKETTPVTTVPTTVPATTAPTSAPTTVPTTTPPMDPSMETNIPDPDVDTSMPDMTDATAGSSDESYQDHTENSVTGNESRKRIR